MKFTSLLYSMRAHRPIGSLLLLWPTLTALWFANSGVPAMKLLFIFSLGVFLMRSAGCVANDLADREFDAHVERTKMRPLVTGELHVKQALSLLIMLVLLSFILVLFTNTQTILLSFVALILALGYPFCKRFTYFPQVILGAAFAMAIPMAFSASEAPLSVTCWLLYLATVIWAVAYDTIYAMVDKSDDLKIGIKSTAILLGRYEKCFIFASHATVLCLFAGIALLHEAKTAFWFAWSLALVSAGYQQFLIRNRHKPDCFKAFLQNNWFGLFLFIAVALGIN